MRMPSLARLDRWNTHPSTDANPSVLETFQPYRAARAMSTRCHHRISTCFAQRGAAIQAEELETSGTLSRAQRKAASA